MPQCHCKTDLCAFCSQDDAKFDQAAHPVQRLFLDQWQPIFAAVCPQYGIDADAALRHAAQASNWADTAIGYNLWALQGQGDAGFVQSFRFRRTGGPDTGGVRPVVVPLAKFGSREAAVAAWCRAATA